jgi:NADH dehydrogenase/NADH:ubiquinone oxidoreductase subunit G
MLTLTIDNQTVQAPEGSTVLQAIRHVGVRFPTLCYWEGLPPYSACRLCIVEMTAPRRLTIPACSFPAEDGQVIATDGPRAVAMRQMMLEFMLARCPNSTVVRALADEAGVTGTRFPLNANPDELCILCGLCVRVCRDLVGAAALAFIGRGSERKVGTPFGLPAEACIGCGACAAVCPTGAVKMEDVDGQRRLTTWHTHVALQPCPSCGRPFTPEPMGFVREHVPDIEHVWGLCPACRRRETVGG